LLLKSVAVAFSSLLVFSVFSYSQEPESAKIWDRGGHNAFTDLVRYKSNFYCTFREGISHVPKDTAENGRIRIIRSADLKTWDPVALLENDRYDLRDPKLSVTPDKRLMVLMGGSHYVNGKLIDMQPHVSFSTDGTDFTIPVPVAIEKSAKTKYDWIWRVTWNGNTGYGVVYQSHPPDNRNKVRLLKTVDGISYNQITEFNIESLPNEATVRFDEDENMIILLRREANANGFLGISAPPYEDWKWKELDYRLGGPDLIVLKNGKLVIGTRLYQPGSASTVIYRTDREGKIQKTVRLPSGGDTSYPGLLLYKKLLLVSYYSSHEGKTSVYLAKIRLNNLLKD
jgi:hypothetical protein